MLVYNERPRGMTAQKLALSSHFKVAMFDALTINAPPQWFYCEPAWHWAPPPLTDFDLWFVAAGRGELRLDGTAHALKGGICFVLKPGSRPLGTHDPQHRLVVFACHFSFNTADPAAAWWPTPYVIRDLNFFSAAAHRMEKLWRRADDVARQQVHLCLQAMLFQLWDEVRQDPLSRQEVEFEQLTEHVRREPDYHWTVDAMAARVHLSRAQFVRRFRQQFVQAPMQFVIGVRLERARQLLRETNLPLRQVAESLGYRDAQFFSRQFKQYYRQTPTQWRREFDMPRSPRIAKTNVSRPR